jgi:hypothetical protein
VEGREYSPYEVLSILEAPPMKYERSQEEQWLHEKMAQNFWFKISLDDFKLDLGQLNANHYC